MMNYSKIHSVAATTDDVSLYVNHSWPNKPSAIVLNDSCITQCSATKSPKIRLVASSTAVVSPSVFQPCSGEPIILSDSDIPAETTGQVHATALTRIALRTVEPNPGPTAGVSDAAILFVDDGLPNWWTAAPQIGDVTTPQPPPGS
mgnify:FL=1